MYVLVACEESQTVTKAFREKGCEAFSCDILEPSGGRPDWHILGDAIPLLNGHCSFYTMDNVKHTIPEKWDLIIAHPPCTYLCCTANRWFNVDRYGDKARERLELRKAAVDFFLAFTRADCDKIAIENPVGVMSSIYKKPDQYIQPCMFGDPFEKKTALWLRGLPKLQPTDQVKPEPRQILRSGKSMPTWYSNAPKNERSKIRSKTFPGIAEAMAQHWT